VKEASEPRERARATSMTVQVVSWLGLSLIVLLLLALCIVVLPRLIYPSLPSSSLEGVPLKDRIQLQDARRKLQNDARTTLIQGLGGTFFVVTAYFTWQQIQNGRRQLVLSQEQFLRNQEAQTKQLQLTERGQITERFSNAIEHVGDDKLDVRLGGIYALVRIAKDSPEDREPIAQILIAFIRSRSPWPPTCRGQYPEAPIMTVPVLRNRAADVQSAITALTGDPLACLPGERRVLSNVDLRRANLWGAQLQGYWIEASNLDGAGLRKATLQGANLHGTSLREANLFGAKLQRANLQDAWLHGANLKEAEIVEIPSDLQGGLQEERELRSAYWIPNLADDGDAFQGTRLTGARANSATQWPTDFDPARAGVRMEEV
jgi:Pentapeptide repeats (8 copies)